VGDCASAQQIVSEFDALHPRAEVACYVRPEQRGCEDREAILNDGAAIGSAESTRKLVLPLL